MVRTRLRTEPLRASHGAGLLHDPANAPLGLPEVTEVIAGHPAYERQTLAQQLYERRLDKRRRRQTPDWFSAQVVVWEPWEREAAHAA